MAETILNHLSLPSWNTHSRQWNQIYIGNVLLPGYAFLKEAGISLRHAKEKAGGQDFGTILIKGLEMPEFTIELLIMSGKDEQQWIELAPFLLPQKDPRERGIFPIYHPTLNRYLIQNCSVVKIRETPPNAGGALKIQIDCIGVSPIKKNASKTIKKKAGVQKKADYEKVDATLPSGNQHNQAKIITAPNPGIEVFSK